GCLLHATGCFSPPTLTGREARSPQATGPWSAKGVGPACDGVVDLRPSLPDGRIFAARMDPIGQEHADERAVGDHPETRSGEAQMAEGARSAEPPGRRVLAALAVEAHAQGAALALANEGLDFVGAQPFGASALERIEDGLAEAEHREGIAEEAGVSAKALAAEGPRVLVVDLADDEPASPVDDLGR